MILQYTQLSFPGSSRDKFRIPGFFRTKIEIQGFPGFSGGVQTLYACRKKFKGISSTLEVRNLCMQALFKDFMDKHGSCLHVCIV